jgi:hypothetical protein
VSWSLSEHPLEPARREEREERREESGQRREDPEAIGNMFRVFPRIIP